MKKEIKKQNSLFKNSIYKSLLSFVNIVIPLIIGPYIVRLLDINLYGVYNRVVSEFQVFLALASFGIYNFGIREISKIRDDKDKVSKLYTNLFVISLITNGIFIIIYCLYSIFRGTGIELTIYLLMIIQLVANAFYIEFVNEALENYKFITLKTLIVKIFYFISILLLVKKPDDIIIYTLIICFTIFVNNIISFIYANKRIKLDFSDIKIKKYIKPLCILVIISNVDLLYSQLDKVMLGYFVNDVSVTIYYTVYYIVATLSAIPYSIISVSLPRLSYLVKNSDKKTYEEKLNNSISSLLFILVPMCFGIVVVAKEIIMIYAGEKYLAAIIPLVVAGISRIFISLESMVINLVMYVNDKEKRMMNVSLTFGLVNLGCNFLLVLCKIFTPTTALISTGLCELSVFIVHYIYARKKLKIEVNFFSKKNLTYFALGLIFIPISIIIRKLSLGFYTTLGLIIILCILLYFAVLLIKKDENLLFILNKLKIKFKVRGA